MTQTADVLVVGAGVIGSSVALELAARGRDVLVVDKAGGAGHGSTSASSAIIRFNYSTPSGVAAAWESRQCWEQWPDHLGRPEVTAFARFHRTGMLHLDTPASPRERTAALLRGAGVPVEELEADDITERFPFLDTGRYWPAKPITDDAFWDDADGRLGGLLTPEAGFVDDPRLAADNLAAAAAARGARFRFRTVVTSVDRHGETWRTGLADGDHVDSAVVVNAAGPWSSALNALAGVGEEFTIGVRPLRQEVHEVPLPRSYAVADAPGPVLSDLDLGSYLRPGLAGTCLVGGTEPECDPLEWVDDPDAVDLRVTRERYDVQLTRAARRVPDLGVPNHPVGIAGVYDVADDWTPIYDRTDAPGYYVAMGTSGNQFKNAPVVGRMVGTLVEEVEAGRDHDADPVHVVGEHTGLDIDLGTFSRKRSLNRDSSGTVMG